VAFQEAAPAGGNAVSTAGVLVPANAIRDGGERDYVFVVVEGRVERRAVATGEARGTDMLVLSGLSSGEIVVVEGPSGLADGDVVQEMRK